MRASSIPGLGHTSRLRTRSPEIGSFPLNNVRTQRTRLGRSVNDRPRSSSTDPLSNSRLPSNYYESDDGDVGAYSGREDVANEGAPPDAPYSNPYRASTPPNRAVGSQLLRSNDPSPLRRSNEAPQTEHLIPAPGSRSNSGTTLTNLSYKPSCWLPWLAVIAPPLIVPMVLGFLIGLYRVPFQMDLFSTRRPDFSTVLIDLEDTNVMLVVSGLNFIMPPVANYIMGLYAPRVVQEFDKDVKNGHFPPLYEFALIGGVCEASLWQLLKTPTRLWRRKKKPKPTKALRLATTLYVSLLLMRAMTYGAIVGLHLTTRTVEHDRLDFIVKDSPGPGRGLTKQCLDHDRTEDGFPCTENLTATDRADQQREEFRLARNTSEKSRIDFAHNIIGNSGLGLLLARDVDASVDYLANTTGLCTECSFITDQCRLRDASEDKALESAYWTIFNCSLGFHGVLGKSPIVVEFYPVPDPDTPYLNFKTSNKLQFGYYFDPGLEFGYNPVGYDALLNRTLPPYTPVELINPVYLAVAGRIGSTGLGASFPKNGTREIWSGQNKYLEFTLRCKITAFDVTYTMVQGSLSVIRFSSANGSIFDLFHGAQLYDTLTSGGAEYSEMLTQAGLQNRTTDVLRKWEQLFTAKALSTIGSVTEERPAETIQMRKRVLVAQMRWVALAAIFACPLCFIAAGGKVIRLRGELGQGELLLGTVLSTAGAGFTATTTPGLMLQALGQEKGQGDAATTNAAGLIGSGVGGGVLGGGSASAELQVTMRAAEGLLQLAILDGQGQGSRHASQDSALPPPIIREV